MDISEDKLTESNFKWPFIENIVCMIAFILIILFAPGHWKWASIAPLLYINLWREKEEKKNEHKQDKTKKD